MTSWRILALGTKISGVDLRDGCKLRVGDRVYVLEVVFPNDERPRHVEHRQNANDVLARIPELLQEHDGCEKVVVHIGPTRLFSVDCKGNTTPG